MCQWYKPYQSEEQGVCSEDHRCCRNMHERQKQCDQLIREGKMRIKNKKLSYRRDSARCA